MSCLNKVKKWYDAFYMYLQYIIANLTHKSFFVKDNSRPYLCNLFWKKSIVHHLADGIYYPSRELFHHCWGFFCASRGSWHQLQHLFLYGVRLFVIFNSALQDCFFVTYSFSSIHYDNQSYDLIAIYVWNFPCWNGKRYLSYHSLKLAWKLLV